MFDRWIDNLISQKRIISHDHGAALHTVSPRNLKPQTHLCDGGTPWTLAAGASTLAIHASLWHYQVNITALTLQVNHTDAQSFKVIILT